MWSAHLKPKNPCKMALGPQWSAWSAIMHTFILCYLFLLPSFPPSSSLYYIPYLNFFYIPLLIIIPFPTRRDR